MNRRGVADTTDADHRACRGDPGFRVPRPDHPEHRAELLPGQGFLGQYQAERCDQHLGPWRHPDPSLFGDPGRVLADRLAVEHPVREQVGPQPGAHVRFEDDRALSGELPGQAVRDGFGGDEHRLVGAQQRVVERFALGDPRCRRGEVGRRVHQDGHVARPDAERGVSGPVGRAHHRGAAGGHDHIGHRVGHQGLD